MSGDVYAPQFELRKCRNPDLESAATNIPLNGSKLSGILTSSIGAVHTGNGSGIADTAFLFQPPEGTDLGPSQGSAFEAVFGSGSHGPSESGMRPFSEGELGSNEAKIDLTINSGDGEFEDWLMVGTTEHKEPTATRTNSTNHSIESTPPINIPIFNYFALSSNPEATEGGV
ncbi:hypothetical protein IAT40_004512 [Kwoniella sp. CBS 6097]